MARARSQEPTPVELEILQALWGSGPVELGEVCERLRQKRPVATTTVATMLGIMKAKGLVKRSRGPRGYLWEAKVSRQAAASGMLKRLMDRVFDGSARRLVAHLLAESALSERERGEIRELLTDVPGKTGAGGKPRG